MQGILASFLLSLSHHRLQTTRFQSVNGPQQFFKPGFNSVNHELPDVQLDLEKAEEPETKLPKVYWIIEKAREFQKNICFCFTDYVNLLTVWIPTAEILQEMGIPDHLIYLVRNLYGGQEATVRTGYGTTGCIQTGKWVCQGCIVSPCLFNLYASCGMLDWMKYRLDSRLLEEISKCRWHHPTGRKQRTKEPLDVSERGEWKR